MHRVAVLCLLLVGIANAHICMWHPIQRSNFTISSPGEDVCYRKPSPCGGVGYDPNGVVTTLTAGQQYTVNFQQNLNHFYTNNPGFLEISIANGHNPQESDFTPIGPTIADYNAMNMVTQTNFSITITVPETQCTACVLRARYLSNNPLENDRGEVFHQCADIKISAPTKQQHQAQKPQPKPHKAATSTLLARPAPPEFQAPASPCCTGKQWVSRAYETGSWRRPTEIITYYDAINNLMRVDTHSGTGTTIYDGDFVMYLNFTSGIEYYLNTVTNVCEPLGLDLWNNWCYGSVNETEVWQQNVLIGDTVASVWANGDFRWAASLADCTPMLFMRDSGMLTIYYNVTAGIPDPTVFNPPANCHLSLTAAEELKPAPAEHASFWKHPLLV